MPSSPERIASNRRNAALSTGPRTSAGKARSRGNALTHGLSGVGIAIPGEDAKVVEARFEALAEDLGARGERERILAHRAAFLALRLERCARFEGAMLTDAIRFAIPNHDDARSIAIEDAVARLPREPATSLRRLARTAQGVDWIVAAWERLVADLDDTGSLALEHIIRAENLSGLRADDPSVSRFVALNRATGGNFLFMTPYGTPPEPHDPDRVAERSQAARVELRRLLVEGADRARDLRAGLPLDDLARSRDEAALRCLFQPSPGACVYRRYEAAAARELHDTLAQFDADRRDEPEEPEEDAEAPSDPSAPIHPNETTCADLASFRNPDPTPVAAEAPAAAPVETPAPARPAPPRQAARSRAGLGKPADSGYRTRREPSGPPAS